MLYEGYLHYGLLTDADSLTGRLIFTPHHQKGFTNMVSSRVRPLTVGACSIWTSFNVPKVVRYVLKYGGNSIKNRARTGFDILYLQNDRL